MCGYLKMTYMQYLKNIEVFAGRFLQLLTVFLNLDHVSDQFSAISHQYRI